MEPLPYAYNRMGGHDLGLNLMALARKELGRRLPVLSYPAGSRIFEQGTPPEAYYLVTSGQVKITRLTPDGNEITLCMPSAGKTFCPVPVMDHGLHVGAATADTRVSLTVVPLADLQRLCAAYPALQAALIEASLNEVRRLIRRLEMNSFRSVEARIAFVLLGAQLPHLSNNRGYEVVTVTHHDLAALAGASRETVSRILSRWTREGVIEGARGRLTILKVDHLRKLIISH